MTIGLFISWFLTFFPITISPGPANILLSSTSAQHGTKRTLPLVWGIVTVFVLQIAAVGFGIGEILERNPALFTIFQYVGAGYLFYLAYLFFRSSGMKNSDETKLGFREGALLQFFNFKALTVPLILFTQFLNPANATQSQYVFLTAALLCLIVGSLLAWVIGGSFLRQFFQSDFGIKWQGKIFGVLLAAVAVWILLR
ncbi:MAG: LysE family translocator [Chloroflexota bacterium]